MARLAPEPRAAAVGAGPRGLVAGELLAHRGRVGLAPAALEAGDDPFERVPALDDARLASRGGGLGAVDELDVLAARAVQQQLARGRGQLLERGVEVEAGVPRHALQQAEGVGVAPVPALDGPRGERQGREGDHAFGVEGRDLAQAVAGGAGAERRVEAEQARLELGQAPAAHRAAVSAAEQVLPGPRRLALGGRVHLERDRAAVGDAQRGLEALGQALPDAGAALQAVDHDVDVVLLGLLQPGQRVGLVDLAGPALAADAETHVAARLHVGEQLAELALAVAHHGRQQHQPRALGQRQHRVDHLAHALLRQRQRVVGAVGRAGACVEQAQVVVDLGDGAHRRARVVAGGLLLDADRRRQALDHVDVGLVHALQELPRVGAEALDVAALALGVQRVEGQARLARARQARDDDERVLRDVEVDVLQVVRARAAHAEQRRRRSGRSRVAGHGGRGRRTAGRRAGNRPS